MTLRPTILAALRYLSIALVMALIPVGGFAQAPDVAGQVAAQLEAQGYRQIKVRRSLLGKVVISAENSDHLREVVIDPRNGDLLRDVIRTEDGGRGDSVAAVGDRDDDDDDSDDTDSGSDDDDDSGSSDDSDSDDSDSDDSSDDDSSDDDSDSDDGNDD